MNLGEYLKLTGTTRREFGRKIGASQPAVTRYVLGDRFPKPDKLKRIARATEGAVTADDFLGSSRARAAS